MLGEQRETAHPLRPHCPLSQFLCPVGRIGREKRNRSSRHLCSAWAAGGLPALENAEPAGASAPGEGPGELWAVNAGHGEILDILF